VFYGRRFGITREEGSKLKFAAHKFVTVNVFVVLHFIHSLVFFQTHIFRNPHFRPSSASKDMTFRA
jgi:hypothetical protein